jgi:hypothetical protein
MGFYLEGATGVNADFGFTRFAATDEEPGGLPARGRWWPAGLLSGPSHRSQTLFFRR